MQKKAFDRTQHPFMIKALNKLSIEGMYHNITSTIYDETVISFPSDTYPELGLLGRMVVLFLMF